MVEKFRINHTHKKLSPPKEGLSEYYLYVSHDQDTKI